METSNHNNQSMTLSPYHWKMKHRPWHFWDVMWLGLAVLLLTFQDSVSVPSSRVMLKLMGCSETTITNCQPTPSNVPEEQRPNCKGSRSPKSNEGIIFSCVILSAFMSGTEVSCLSTPYKIIQYNISKGNWKIKQAKFLQSPSAKLHSDTTTNKGCKWWHSKSKNKHSDAAITNLVSCKWVGDKYWGNYSRSVHTWQNTHIPTVVTTSVNIITSAIHRYSTYVQLGTHRQI